MSVHHSCVIAGCGIVILSNQYIGFSVVALLMEVNSIFLHTRALLQYCNKRKTTWFKIAAVGNVITNIVFRLGANYHIWMWTSNSFFLGITRLRNFIFVVQIFNLFCIKY